jgi:hypothetical protein
VEDEEGERALAAWGTCAVLALGRGAVDGGGGVVAGPLVHPPDADRPVAAACSIRFGSVCTGVWGRKDEQLWPGCCVERLSWTWLHQG